MDKLDHVVIGAGVGGMACASALARAGRRVTVFEQLPHPGGTAYMFFRKGFWFPMGPQGFGNPDRVTSILESLGVEMPELKRVHYRLRAFGFDLPLSLPFAETGEALAEAFPHDRAGIRAFFERISDIIVMMREPAANAAELKKAARARVSDFLAERVADPRLRCILGTQGTEPGYSSLVLSAAMWGLLCEDGIWYPTSGMKDMCERMAKAATNAGAELILSTRVVEILVEKARARGVRLDSGEEVWAGSVVSDADYPTTALDLLGSHAPPEFARAVKKARQTESVFQVALGLDRNKIDLSAFHQAGRVIHRREGAEGGLDFGRERLDPFEFAGLEMEIALLIREFPGAAPPGSAALTIRILSDYEHFRKFWTGRGKRSAEYAGYKRALAEAVIGEASKVVPGIERAIMVMEVSTPLTFADQGGRFEGAVAGWSWNFEDSRDFAVRELTLTPVEGLYMSGYQAMSTLFMGGVPTALTSGITAARAAMKNEGPVDKILIPGGE